VPDDPPSSPIEPFRPLPEPTLRERADAIVDRVRSLGPSARVVLAVGVSASVLVIAIVLLRPAGADQAPEASLPRATAPVSSGPASTAPTSAVVIVQAAGAVAQPGLYRLPPGSRVDDLVRAAGGLAADADPDRVNLAAVLVDGEKIYIPRIGEPVPADAAGDASPSTPQPVDLNTATIAELDTLPGIGPTTAQAIVDYRSQHGRFQSVDELLNVRGIGPTKLDELRPLVRV
jgi:competence protein ComEA